MNDQPDPETLLYEHAVMLFRAHARMLTDARRNAAFFSALQAHVTPDSFVVDIGAGTGLWAIAAATLGARKVVAIESDPLLLGLIKALAAENGVADRLHVVIGDSRQVALQREFDIVLSETIGNLGFDEQIIPVMADARERFLKPGGRLIPGSVALKAAPAHFHDPEAGLPKGMKLKFSTFESLNLHIPAAGTDSHQLECLAPPAELVRVDLTTADAGVAFGELNAAWALSDLQRVSGFAVWAESILSEGLALSNRLTSSWSPVIYRIQPLPAGSGTVEFKLTTTSRTHFWTVNVAGGAPGAMQSFSPSFAAANLLAQMRAAEGAGKAN